MCGHNYWGNVHWPHIPWSSYPLINYLWCNTDLLFQIIKPQVKKNHLPPKKNMQYANGAPALFTCSHGYACVKTAWLGTIAFIANIQSSVFTMATGSNESTYVLIPRWDLTARTTGSPNYYCWTHNTCSSISKTHADALNNYWVSRQREQQGSCLCNCPQQCKHCTIIAGRVPNCTGRAYNCTRCSAQVRLRSFGSLILWISLRSPPDLLHRWNSPVYKQSAMGKLVFACLWVAGNSCRGEQPHHNSRTKP